MILPSLSSVLATTTVILTPAATGTQVAPSNGTLVPDNSTIAFDPEVCLSKDDLARGMTYCGQVAPMVDDTADESTPDCERSRICDPKFCVAIDGETSRCSLPRKPGSLPPVPPRPFPRHHNAGSCPVKPGNNNFTIGPVFPPAASTPAEDVTGPILGDPSDALLDAPVLGVPLFPSADAKPKPGDGACQIIAQTNWTSSVQINQNTSPLLLQPDIRYAFSWASDVGVFDAWLLAYRLKDSTSSSQPEVPAFLWTHTFRQTSQTAAVVEFTLKKPTKVSLSLRNKDKALPDGEIVLYQLGN